MRPPVVERANDGVLARNVLVPALEEAERTLRQVLEAGGLPLGLYSEVSAVWNRTAAALRQARRV